jgi:hypothetical protein
MIFAPAYSRHERRLIGRLQLLGMDAERSVSPRHQFASELRDRLLAEATEGPCCGDESGRALAC